MSEATGIDPRLPTPDRDSQAWWDALARHEDEAHLINQLKR